MTLKELITTNPEIAKIYIELRDEKGHLITAYHIGALETEDRCLSPNNEPRWITIPKELNIRRTGKDYWGVIVSAIPKSLLDKQVTNWSSWYAHGYECNNGLEDFSWLTVNLLGSDFRHFKNLMPSKRSSEKSICSVRIDQKLNKPLRNGKPLSTIILSI